MNSFLKAWQKKTMINVACGIRSTRRIYTMFMDRTEKKQMGLNARKLYEESFARDRFLDKLEEELRKC